MLVQQQWEAIHERRSRGLSISGMARELDLDRKTVRSCLQQAAWAPYRRVEASSLLDPHRQQVAQRPPEADYSARILSQELRSQSAFWAAAGLVDTDLSFSSFLELYRADVSKRRVSASWVVEPLDVVEDI